LAYTVLCPSSTDRNRYTMYLPNHDQICRVSSADKTGKDSQNIESCWSDLEVLTTEYRDVQLYISAGKGGQGMLKTKGCIACRAVIED